MPHLGRNVSVVQSPERAGHRRRRGSIGQPGSSSKHLMYPTNLIDMIYKSLKCICLGFEGVRPATAAALSPDDSVPRLRGSSKGQMPIRMCRLPRFQLPSTSSLQLPHIPLSQVQMSSFLSPPFPLKGLRGLGMSDGCRRCHLGSCPTRSYWNKSISGGTFIILIHGLEHGSLHESQLAKQGTLWLRSCVSHEMVTCGKCTTRAPRAASVSVPLM